MIIDIIYCPYKRCGRRLATFDLENRMVDVAIVLSFPLLPALLESIRLLRLLRLSRALRLLRLGRMAAVLSRGGRAAGAIFKSRGIGYVAS